MIVLLVSLWLTAGVQVLLFMLWCLVSQRSTVRLKYTAAIKIVVFWPDMVASIIKHVRKS